MSDDLKPSVASIVNALLSSEKIGDETIVRLPIIMPSGSSVTVRIVENKGAFYVGDLGLAYREADSLGFAHSFTSSAKSIVERHNIERRKVELCVRTSREELYRAICDVGMASWQVSDVLAGRAEEHATVELNETVIDRLERLFGKDKVETEPTVFGQSRNPWSVTAVVHAGRRPTIFQAVGKHAQSIYRTNTAFHDLSILDEPPNLVSVVRDKTELGNRLGLLSQMGRVIESEANDAVYLNAA